MTSGNEGVQLFEIRKDVICLNCDSKGAYKYFGKYYAKGLGEDAFLEKYKDKPYMSRAMGFGGTIPHRCLNCDAVGLIDSGGLEGYKKQFKSL